MVCSFRFPLENEKQTANRNPTGMATTSLEAQRINRAVLNYDFIYLMIGFAATLLFLFETLYRVYQLYQTNNGRKRRKRKKRQTENQELDISVRPNMFNHQSYVICKLISRFHEQDDV